MARTASENGSKATDDNHDKLTFQADGAERIELPSADFIADAKMVRDGDDLVLEAPNGEIAVIEGYFNADPAPLLQSPDGATLTPNLVDAFARSPLEFAANETASDVSPVGAVEEVKGNATVTRADGTVETITNGTPIYQGDVIQTDASGAVNIVFIDETSMAVSENARLAIDEYSYDPSTESGTTNFSVLRGLFVFTSGLIGRDDPDDVKIDTPVGSIGIRGTIIAGEIHPGGESNISVLEGAIVITNGAGELTLSQQFETVRLMSFNEPMKDMGVMHASDISARFSSVSSVNPSLFSMIEDAVKQEAAPEAPAQTAPAEQNSQTETAPQADAQQPQAAVAAPPAAPAPDALASIDSSVASLNTAAGSGLPSAETVAGQPSAGLAGSSAATGTSSTSSTAGATAATGTASSGAAAPGTAAANTAPSIADTTQPAPVVNTPTGPSLVMSGGTFNDITVVSTVIGNVAISDNRAGVTYTTTNANFTIDANGDVKLSAAGAALLAGSLDTVSLGTLDVTALDGATTLVQQTFGLNITDASGNKTLDLDTATTGVTRITDNIGNMIGYSLTALGDVDNDGFDDFAFTNGVDNQNHIYKVYGGNLGVPSGSVLSLDTAGSLEVVQNPRIVVAMSSISIGDPSFGGTPGLDPTNLEVLINTTPVPPANYSYNPSTGLVTFTGGFTPSVGGIVYLKGSMDTSNTIISGVGDFDGDGVEDYIIGQSANNVGSTQSGNAAVVSGADHTKRVYFNTGMPSMAEIGESVSGIGDFNNDGYADVIIGAPGISGGQGGAYFVKGGPGWNTALNVAVQPLYGTTNSSFGISVEGIGDFDGDGYSDFAIGAPNATSGFGTVSIYSGNQNGTAIAPIMLTAASPVGLGEDIIGLGDINGDGFSDIMVGGSGNNGYIYFGGITPTSSDISLNIPGGPTGYAISGGGKAGDFNGDGYDDFTVSLTNGDETRAYVVYGKSVLPGQIDLNYLKNGGNAFEITYSDAVDNDELEFTSLGDVNGDGYDDLGIGAPDIDLAGNGEVLIVYGRDTGSITSGTTATVDGQHLIGSRLNDVLNASMYDNVSMRGGAGNDTLQIENTNFLGVHGGAGNMDMLSVLGDLNFANVNYEKMSGIEMIGLNGADGQTITLTMENLFNLLKSSSDGTLRIEAGAASQRLNLFFDTTDNSNLNLGDIASAIEGEAGLPGGYVVDALDSGYNTFQIGGYKLLIDAAVAVDVT